MFYLLFIVFIVATVRGRTRRRRHSLLCLSQTVGKAPLFTELFMAPGDFSAAARAAARRLVTAATTARTNYRYSKLVKCIQDAAPNEKRGVSAFMVYLDRAKPTILTARVALSAYKQALAADGLVLGAKESVLRRAIQGLAAGPPQQERHAITGDEAAKVFAAAARKKQGTMYKHGFMVAFSAGLRHQQLAKLTVEHFERTASGALSIVFRTGLKGIKPASGIRPPEVHVIPHWANNFFEQLIKGREGLLFPTWATGRANEIIKETLGSVDADGRPIVMHSFKHAAAIDAVARGADVRARTGHTSDVSVARYSRDNVDRRPARPAARRRKREDDDG